MPAQDNKAIVSNFLDQLWNHRDKSVIGANISDDYVDHTPPPKASDDKIQGPEAFSNAFDNLVNQDFPDIQLTIVDQITEGDKVASILTWKSTALKFTMTGIGIDRIDDSGKIIENWNTLDVLYRVINLLGMPDPLHVDPHHGPGPGPGPKPPLSPCIQTGDCDDGFVCSDGQCTRG